MKIRPYLINLSCYRTDRSVLTHSPFSSRRLRDMQNGEQKLSRSHSHAVGKKTRRPVKWLDSSGNKKLSYDRGTARRAMWVVCLYLYYRSRWLKLFKFVLCFTSWSY